MKKVRRYFFSSSKKTLHCEVFINGKLSLIFQRNITTHLVVADGPMVDVTTFDLELHAFLRFSHQLIVNPDILSGEKIEEMFELENPTI